MGHDQDANRLVMEMGRLHRPHLSPGAQVWDWVKDWLLGYGHNPTGLVITILAILSIGWGIFQGGYTNGAILPSEGPVYVQESYQICKDRETLRGMLPSQRLEHCLEELYPEYMAFNAFVFSLDVFVPLVDLHQESAWEPRYVQGTWAKGYGVRVWYWVQIALGWILTTLAVVALTGAVKPKYEKE